MLNHANKETHPNTLKTTVTDETKEQLQALSTLRGDAPVAALIRQFIYEGLQRSLPTIVEMVDDQGNTPMVQLLMISNGLVQNTEQASVLARGIQVVREEEALETSS